MILMSSLGKPVYRMVGMAIAAVGILIFALLKWLNYSYLDGWENKIFIINHYIIILGFIMVTYSKEKYEDERIQKIRFRLFQFSYAFTVIGITLYLTISLLDRVHFNYFIIFYIIEGILILYQTLFRVFLATNPEWVFTGNPRKNRSFIVMTCGLLFLIGWIFYVVMHYKL